MSTSIIDQPFHLVRSVNHHSTSEQHPSLRCTKWCYSLTEYATPIICLKNSLSATTTLAAWFHYPIMESNLRLVHRLLVVHFCQQCHQGDSLSWRKFTSIATVLSRIPRKVSVVDGSRFWILLWDVQLLTYFQD